MYKILKREHTKFCRWTKKDDKNSRYYHNLDLEINYLQPLVIKIKINIKKQILEDSLKSRLERSGDNELTWNYDVA